MNGYVVCCAEHLQDGHEYWAKVFGTIEGALQYMAATRNNRHTAEYHNLDIQLFEMGKEIKVEQFTEEEAVVTKKEKVGFRVKKGK